VEPSNGSPQPDAASKPGESVHAAPESGLDQPQPTPQVADSSPKPPKAPLIKRIWRRLNIYLLLFILIVLVAVAVVIVLVVKDRAANPAQTTTSSQNLSSSALQQLANAGVTVGDPKQVLNIQSNTVFAGSVLMRGNLEIAGGVKIGGDLALPGITVSGSSRLGDVQANSLAVGGPTSVQGVLTAKNGINVTGNSNFAGNLSTTQLTTGALQLNGDLQLTHHITAGGPIPALSKGTAVGGGGTASLSGSDTAGSIAINTGDSPPAGCFASVTFSRAFSATPHVLVTPVGASAAGLQFYTNRSTTGFSICTANSAPAGQTFGFDYVALD
jgi:cytoskeletal protein CcmA (bactofilin family)